MDELRINLVGVYLGKLAQCLCLWEAGELIRTTRPELIALRENWTDEKKAAAGRLIDNGECSYVWGRLFKEYKEADNKIGAVYFIEDRYGERVKIGFTKTLWRRFEEINIASGGQCRILLAVPVEEDQLRRIEHIFHLTYPGKRLSGEWFQKADAEGDFVADMVDGLYEMLRRVCKKDGYTI